ncbi:recombinase family protein [Streptacidiphilus cavernicola]|uniref:Recombinase family protein n=1 Tax=Streptacidiphilus cavernicola TaxID=3342716 RepID=A0ABV6W069_9ACTN
MTNVVGYGRVSTGNQKTEGTIDVQRHEVHAYCAEHELHLLKFFGDEGVSGGLEDRAGLSQLFEFLEDVSGIKAVVIYKLDRIARDLLIQEHLLKKLSLLGVEIVSIKEPDLAGDEPVRKFTRQIMGGVAELEKAYITMRLTDGRKNKARKGGYAGGGVPFGYMTTQDGDLAVHPERAEVVRLIFKLRRRRVPMSYNAIADYLNENLIPTAQAARWYARTVKNVCENAIYRGKLTYGGNISLRPDLALTGSRQRTAL